MPPLTYLHAAEADRRTAGGGGVGGTRDFNEFLMRRELNNTNGEKIMAETFGRSKNLYTLSLSLSLSHRYSPTITYTLLKYAGARVNIRLSLQKCKGGQFLLLHPLHALLKNSYPFYYSHY